MAERKRKKKKSRITIGRILTASVLLFAIAFLAITLVNRSFLKSTANVGKSKGDGFPYAVNAKQVLEFSGIQNNLLVLTNTELVVLDEVGDVLSSVQHGFSKPMTVQDGDKFLFLDRYTGKYSLRTSSRVLYESSLESEIITAGVNSRGHYALAYRESASTSTIGVYNKRGHEIFKNNLFSGHIISVALSTSGKYVAYATISTDQGDVQTKVYVYNTNETELHAEFDCKDGIVADLFFNSAGQLVVVGENFIKTTNTQKKEIALDEETQNTLSKVSKNSSYETALSYSKYGSDMVSELKLFCSKGDNLFTKEIDGSVRGLSNNKKEIALLADMNIFIFDKTGQELRKIDLINRSENIVLTENALYILYSDEIVKSN